MKFAKSKFSEYVIFFMAYSIIGWIYETVLEVVIYRWGFSNRGVLTGPWLPVYGVGAVLFLLLWYRLIKNQSAEVKWRRLTMIYLLTMATATLVELIASYICEWTMGSWPWQTYADYAINFQARIALNPSIRFGLGGVLFLYIIQPLLDKLTDKMGSKKTSLVAVVLIAVVAVDVFITFIYSK